MGFRDGQLESYIASEGFLDLDELVVSRKRRFFNWWDDQKTDEEKKAEEEAKKKLEKKKKRVDDGVIEYKDPFSSETEVITDGDTPSPLAFSPTPLYTSDMVTDVSDAGVTDGVTDGVTNLKGDEVSSTVLPISGDDKGLTVTGKQLSSTPPTTTKTITITTTPPITTTTTKTTPSPAAPSTRTTTTQPPSTTTTPPPPITTTTTTITRTAKAEAIF